MKFMTLENGQLGVLVDDIVVDLPAAAAALGESPPAGTLTALVAAGDDAARAAWLLAGRAVERDCACRAYSAVRPAAPLPEPRGNTRNTYHCRHQTRRCMSAGMREC